MEYTLNEVAKKLHITKDTLRYYEKMNLINSKRKENNYRYYDEDDLMKLKYIKVMKSNDFTLKEIEMFIQYFHTFDEEMCFIYLNDIIKSKQKANIKKIENLKKTNVLLEEVLKLKEDRSPEVIAKLDKLVDEIASNIIDGEEDE